LSILYPQATRAVGCRVAPAGQLTATQLTTHNLVSTVFTEEDGFMAHVSCVPDIRVSYVACGIFLQAGRQQKTTKYMTNLHALLVSTLV